MTDLNLPDVSALSTSEKARVARTASRKPGSEAALIFGSGGAVFAMVEFWAKFPLSAPLAAVTGMSQIGAWFVVSFGLAGLIAILHAMRLPKTVKQAQDTHAAVQYMQQDARREEIEQRIQDMSR